MTGLRGTVVAAAESLSVSGHPRVHHRSERAYSRDPEPPPHPPDSGKQEEELFGCPGTLPAPAVRGHQVHGGLEALLGERGEPLTNARILIRNGIDRAVSIPRTQPPH